MIFLECRSTSTNTTSRWAALLWVNCSLTPSTINASFLIIPSMSWAALTVKVNYYKPWILFSCLLFVQTHVKYGFNSNLQERVVSSHMMLLVPMRELDIVPKVPVPLSSCLFWITSWSLPVLSYCPPRCVIDLNHGCTYSSWPVIVTYVWYLKLWPSGCCYATFWIRSSWFG